jgi:xanthine/CO dehydrogenase XdhC/CoxF family maturation factor
VPTFYESLATAAAKDGAVALGIITKVKGSNPQKIGARALFYANGRLAGAGHIAQAVAPLALGLDFAVTVFDDRAALAASLLSRGVSGTILGRC